MTTVGETFVWYILNTSHWLPFRFGNYQFLDLPICPEFRVGIFSQIAFSWLNPTIQKGFRKPLELSDLWRLEESDTNEYLAGRLRQELDIEQSKPFEKQSLQRVLIRIWATRFLRFANEYHIRLWKAISEIQSVCIDFRLIDSFE